MAAAGGGGTTGLAPNALCTHPHVATGRLLGVRRAQALWVVGVLNTHAIAWMFHHLCSVQSVIHACSSPLHHAVYGTMMTFWCPVEICLYVTHYNH